MTDFKLPVGGVVSVVTVDCFRERGDTGGADNGSEGVQSVVHGVQWHLCVACLGARMLQELHDR